MPELMEKKSQINIFQGDPMVVLRSEVIEGKKLIYIAENNYLPPYLFSHFCMIRTKGLWCILGRKLAARYLWTLNIILFKWSFGLRFVGK